MNIPSTTINPVSTYRLQFNGDFRLADARKILGYLHRMGIRTIYASPVFHAVSGSKHGYDVTDPLHLNPETGSDRMFRKLIEEVHGRRMAWLQDIVPNHMAYSTENPWIYQVLVHGKGSEYHRVFDIVEGHPDGESGDRLMLPFFGKDLDGIIRDGELKLRFGERGFSLEYYDHEYPVSARAYPFILETGAVRDPAAAPGKAPDTRADRAGSNGRLPERITELLTGFGDLAAEPTAEGKWEEHVERLFREYCSDPGIAGYVDRCMDVINGDPARMGSLAGRLEYLPVHWRETEKRINYRRFFTINGLICVNNHLDEVFDLTHGLIRRWVEQGLVDGLRVDHIDGLYDPDVYLANLRRLSGERACILVEKILGEDEALPASWPVQGTTGYDFLALATNLLTGPDSDPFFNSYYGEWTGKEEDPERAFLEKKRWILHHRMGGELELLTDQCMSAFPFRRAQLSREDIRKAIAAFMVRCPVYRYYGAPSVFTEKERDAVRKIMEHAGKDEPGSRDALAFLEHMFPGKDTGNIAQAAKTDRLFRRIMQFTGPLMAKGLEDTAFYTYNAFIAHNEVGYSPGYPGIDKETFHNRMIQRREKYPLTMNTLSTHDTKRGEDARARLCVISDMRGRWKEATTAWRMMNSGSRNVAGGKEVPAAADEYMIYQALCAHMPMKNKADESFTARFRDYLVKALREGKERSSWSSPDTEYEAQTLAFVNHILEPGHAFLHSLLQFTSDLIPHGIVNSITQIILRNTVPGVPDTFQGSETWNLSFVDPDNRRNADYNTLSGNLDRMLRTAAGDPLPLLEELWEHAADGRIKQWICHLTLRERTEHPDLFLRGSYIPLRVTGKYRDHILAFYRAYRDKHLVVAVPLHTARMPKGHDWKDTSIRLPDLAPVQWEERLTRRVVTRNGRLNAGQLFQHVPFAILGGIPNKPKKRAGILMHVSSLPGEFGTGDFGPGAYRFIDFLQRAGQRCWQILPLSATGPRTGYSPYSPRSAFAGNLLLVDPYRLVETGLLDEAETGPFRMKAGSRSAYPEAEKAKHYFLDTAWKAFRKSGHTGPGTRYNAFLEEEKYWLGDYALFEALKQEFSERPWYKWPAEFRDRDARALEEFQHRHRERLDRVIFGQFMFREQWNRLKAYAGDRSVDIFGDVPFYVDHDSADVWAHPGMFRLRVDKRMESVAGVPPDYFNKNGQLWGMPLYNWEAMKADGYRWWLERIEKNLQWYHLIRLDHFRGFSACWEVPAGAASARDGRWREGPGTDLFDEIKDRYPDMPVVAEDLGQIDQDVYDLRDRYRLPGMKVIQFGFGRRMAFSHHFPGNITYNSIVYTGTHDNNTMRGWYRKEADKATLKRFRAFAGKKPTKKNVHREMIRIAYASPARLAIIPMQDWLGLDERSRMNFPSTIKGNWLWRVKKDDLTGKLAKKTRKKVRQFGRY